MGAQIIYQRLTAQTAQALDGADVFDRAPDTAQLDAFLADGGHELVMALQDGRCIGFASGTVLLHPDKPPCFFINEVGVNAPFRRQGIGAVLCNALVELARARGCKGIWLATEADNAPARALYRALKAGETEAIVVYDWDEAMPMKPEASRLEKEPQG